MIKKEVIAFFGGTKKVSQILHISHSSVSQWGDVIPEKQSLKLEKITNGGLEYDPSLYREPNELMHQSDNPVNQ